MRGQIKKGAIIGYVNLAVSMIVTFLYTPFMLKLMGQSEYGLYSLATSIMAYLSVLDMGFGNAMIRFISRSQAKKDKKESKINGMFLLLYSIVGAIALVVGLLITLNTHAIFGGTLSVQELDKMQIIMLILTITISLSFPLSIFDSYAMANERYSFLKTAALVKTILVPVIMIPLLLGGFRSITMALVTSVLTLGCHFASLAYCFKKIKMKISFTIKKLDKTFLKEVLAYSFFILLNIIVDAVFNNTDQVILGAVCGTVAVSVYAVAANIIKMNLNFSTVISGLFLPKVTKMLEEKDGDKKISDLFIKVSRIQLYILLLFLSGFLIFGKMFITLWAGEQYLDAYYITLIMIGPAIIPLSQNIGLSVIQAKNKHQFRSVMYIIISVLNVGISIPLAMNFQGIGAAIGSAIANLLGQIITMNIFYYKKINLDIPTYWKNFLKLSLPVFAVSIGLIFFINKLQSSWLVLIVGAGLYSVIYFVWIYIFMNKEEKGYIGKFINKVLKRTDTTGKASD